MLAVELAKFLDAEGIVDFQEASVDGDCFIEKLPQDQPEGVVVCALYATGGGQESSLLGHDSPTIQVIVRGSTVAEVAFSKAEAIIAKMHGLRGVELTSGGTYVVGCVSQQSAPVRLGQDSSGRHEYSINLRFMTYAPTEHSE